jgi:hypothetical protein
MVLLLALIKRQQGLLRFQRTDGEPLFENKEDQRTHQDYVWTDILDHRGSR